MMQDEIRVLSIIDGSIISDFVDKASQILNIEESRVKEIVEYFVREELVKTISLVNKEIFTYSPSVDKRMLDKGLYEKYGSKPLYIY